MINYYRTWYKWVHKSAQQSNTLLLGLLAAFTARSSSSSLPDKPPGRRPKTPAPSMDDDFATSIANHLADLIFLASEKPGSTGVVAKDTAASIENLCKNLLDEQLSGAVSLLFERDAGLCTAMDKSLQNVSRQDASLVELRCPCSNSCAAMPAWVARPHTNMVARVWP